MKIKRWRVILLVSLMANLHLMIQAQAHKIQKRYEPSLNIIVAGIAAGYLPWFFFQKRTVFTFYAIVFEPFLILAIIYCAYIALLHFKNSRNTYVFIGVIGIAIFINFIYFLPLFTGDVITYEAWQARMWLPSWI